MESPLEGVLAATNPIQSVEGFFDALQRSNLLASEQMAASRQAGSGFPDSKSVALALIAQGLLTRWQAGQLLAGRHALFLGKYKLLERIGAGGMGAVYRAERVPDGRIVAIKVMSKGLLSEPEALRRFQREARAAAALSHPNVVAWIDHGVIGPTHYLAMEYVRGRDLGAWIDEFGRLPIDWSAECIRQAALGLQHAHEQGMVHRDIKPSNILVASDDASSLPLVKILDLGLARFPHADGEHSELTRTGQIMGTPDYMAVEQAENTKTADIRSDIFSLGCTLFKLLTGELPFKGESAMEKLIARVKYDAPLVSRLRPETPPKLAEIVARMLARQPKDRFQTPGEVATALAPFSLAMSSQGESSSCLRLKSISQITASIEAMPDPGLADVVNQLASRAQPLAPSPAQTFIAEPTPVSPTMFNPESPTVSALEPTASDWRSRLRTVPLAIFFAVGAGLMMLVGMVYAMTRPSPVVTRVPAPISPSTAHVREPARAAAPFDAAEARRLQTAWASYLKVEPEITNGIGMKLMLIPPGDFEMGSRDSDTAILRDTIARQRGNVGMDWLERAISEETPLHRVRIARPFYLGKLEVTQEEYRQLVPNAQFMDAQSGHPADRSNWLDAVNFCNALSTQEKLPQYYAVNNQAVSIAGGAGYRLPTEAEWEFACRAGTESAWSFGQSPNVQAIQAHAWVNKHGPTGSHTRAGSLQANPWGLHDVHGNVWEWCWDEYRHDHYTADEQQDPLGPAGREASRPGRQHILRGGGYAQTPLHCRSAMRLGYGVTHPPINKDCGFRVARGIQP